MNLNYGKHSLDVRLKSLRSKKRKRAKKITSTIREVVVIALIGVIAIGTGLGVGAYQGIVDSSPNVNTIDVSPKGFSTFVYDAKGNQIAKLVSSDSNRIPVEKDQITDNLAHAFVAIEDERFYTHNGIDTQGILRAIGLGLQSGSFDQGASTITQQLIKNNVFTNWTNESTAEKIKRKIQEQYLALQLEKKLDKETILTDYLNTINLGHSTYGVESASERYFNKSCDKLSVSECAVLAAIPQSPTLYDPINNPDNNKRRREEVLSKMLSQGYITQDEYDTAEADDVYAEIASVNEQKEKEESQVNSYFVDALTDEVLTDLQDDAGYTESQAYALLYSGGLTVNSTQDPDIQKICDEQTAESSGNYPSYVRYYLNYRLTVTDSSGKETTYTSDDVKKWLQNDESSSSLLYNSKDEAQSDADRFRAAMVGEGDTYTESVDLAPQPEISLTVSDPKTGHIVALVGGRGEKTANLTLNRATDTTRQPGSTFKILSTYAPALDTGKFTLASTEVDEPYSYENGTPVHNWYSDYRGTVTLRTAIENSMNIVTVKVLTAIKPRLGYEYCQKLGISTLVDGADIDGKSYTDVTQTLALGGITYGVKNYELNSAYAAIANGGVYVEPKMYTTVTDRNGKVILDSSNTAETHRALKATTAYLLTSAMESVVQEGTGTGVDFGTTAIAGKTGTTENENDVWFAGYTTNYCATAWAGYDNNTDLTTQQEQKLAQTIWRAVMSRIPANQTYSDFTEPDGIVEMTVCKNSGKRPYAGICPTITEYFDKDTAPSDNDYCDVDYDKYVQAQQAAQAAAAQRAAEEAARRQAAQQAAQAAQEAQQDAQGTGEGTGTGTGTGTESGTGTGSAGSGTGTGTGSEGTGSAGSGTGSAGSGAGSAGNGTGSGTAGGYGQ